MKMILSNVYCSILFNLIIRDYFLEHRCVLILSDRDFDYNGSLPSVKTRIVGGNVGYDTIFHYYGCQGVVIYSDNSTQVFKEFEKEIRLSLERFNRRRFLILMETHSEETFFKLEELNFVSDLLLVHPQDDGVGFDLKTHEYVGPSNNNEPIFLDRWFGKNQSFLFGANLYPDKLSNQLGRPLRMASFTYEPYTIIGSTNEEHQGSELRSGVEFGLKFNMSPTPIVNEKDYWGEIFPNWSGNGLLGNLAEDKADIGFAALYTWEYCYHYLDLSKPLVRTGITCLVPAPKLAARWLTPLLSYSPNLWLCVSIVISSAILALSLILTCYSRNKTLIHGYHPKKKSYIAVLATSTSTVLKPILLQPLPPSKTPEQLATKFMLGLIHILGLLLTSTYDSGFATVMTLPRYEDSIDTVEDFARSGLDWGATQDAWITSIENAEEPAYVQIVSKFHPISEEALEEFSKTGSFAFSIERLPFDNYAIGDYIKDEVIDNFHVMEQDLYWEQCVIMLRKNSVLLPFLDMFILRIFEAGLISKWQNEAVNMFMNPYVQRAVRFYRHRLQEHEVVRLEWSHVEGAFAILAIGYIVSFVVFVVEVLLRREK